ncbi:MAG: tRNA (N(6)-L-threonylcarbamoyladenosine(37)-C(2))-methylthiotransferase MtaB, partial [Oscillospiraceae bacterium]|nr:tRNA (N(6)-L-threonylcarbamoyladenosine(37)-C(2))-methylthiotransferase MtaB [Oscillospiraceae bacterium]
VRPGTPAAAMPDQVPLALREARVRRAGQVAAEMERRYLARWVGSTLPVLFETGSKGHAPNYVQVQADRPVPQNTLARVSITGLGEGFLRGTLLPEPSLS